MTKNDYIEAYEHLTERAMEAADEHYDKLGIPKDKRDYGEWIGEFEVDANSAEVVGYYLEAYPYDYFPVWLDNIYGITLTDQDKEVSLILNKLWDEQFGKYDLDVYKAIECCVRRTCRECPYNVYSAHICKPLLLKDTAHRFGRLMWEVKEKEIK